MRFVTKLLPLAALGAVLSVAQPAVAVVRSEAPAAGFAATQVDDDRYERRRHRGHYGGPPRWRGPPPRYGYYAPPPRAYYPQPYAYYPPPRAYYPPPRAYYAEPSVGLYFRF